jgi:DNA polymerase
MKNLKQKIHHLVWLNSIGVGYYCSTKKDSQNSVINVLKKTNELSTQVPILDEHKKKEPMTRQNKVITAIDTKIESESRLLADKANNLTELKEAVENFTGCELKQFANNVVFADGVPGSKILLVGEAPGVTEDQQGIPFCGESGKLLDRMLETIGISRAKNAYITNTVFWRPPANRKPTKEEINICRPFVEKHIALIKPKIIIVVGATATSALLGQNGNMNFIRENNYSYTNQYLQEPIFTTAIFHPAYLLRQPMQKKATWFDLLKIQNYIAEMKINL